VTHNVSHRQDRTKTGMIALSLCLQALCRSSLRL
jgi:hypothetical protein